MRTQIVIVDDEKDIADLVELYLQNEPYDIKKFYDSMAAYSYMKSHVVDLAILDVMMPGMDGMKICEELRKYKLNFPILLLTAKDSEVDKVKGFNCGADDYITKPFLPMELVARVKACLRRYRNFNEGQESINIHMIQGLFMDEEKHICTLNEKKLSLTPKEFAILAYLCSHQGSICSPDQIFEAVWKEAYYTAANNTVMVHIRHLREKMKDDSENPKYIKTVWGVGYKIEE